MSNNLNNIQIVLVRTFHSGNIGSTARAMKTMGLNNLSLVNPKDFPSKETLQQAHQMARTAADVVDNAIVFDSLKDALKDCTLVIASTARPRGFDLPELTPEESAVKLCSLAKKQKVALVFGPERMGLSNDDLKLCRYRATIPTSPDYSSLNLAAAVQTLGYEIYKQHLILQNDTEASELDEIFLPSTDEMEKFYIHLEETLQQSEFIYKKHPGEVMQKLRTLFTRAQVEKSELNILRGMLASFQRNRM